MPTRKFTTTMDDGERFSFEWDTEKQGRPTKKTVLELYEASKPKKEPEEEPGFISSAWDTLNKPLLEFPSKAGRWIADKIDAPDLDTSPGLASLKGFAAGATEGLGDVLSSMTSPLELAGAALTGGSSLAAKRGLGGIVDAASVANKMIGTGVAAHGATQAFGKDKTWQERLMGGVEMAGGTAGAMYSPTVKPNAPLIQGLDDIDYPPIDQSKQFIDAAGREAIRQAELKAKGFVDLPERNKLLGPHQEVVPNADNSAVVLPVREELNPIKQEIPTYGIDETLTDPTGSGLNVPTRFKAPSTNQTVIDALIPSALKERIRGVESGLDIGNQIVPEPITAAPGEVVTDVPKPPKTKKKKVPKDRNPILDKAAETSPELAEAVAQVKATRSVKESVADPLFKSGTAILDNLGDSGKELSRLLKRTRAEGSIEAGTMSNRVRKIVDDIDDKDFDAIVDIMEGKMTTNNPTLTAKATELSTILDELGTLAETSGMEMMVPSGQVTAFKKAQNYFPHIFEDGFFDKNIDSIKAQLLKDGIVQDGKRVQLSVKEVDNILKAAIEKGPRLISPQHMRSLDLPGYRKDKGALYKHIDDMHNRIAQAKNLGARDIGDPESTISKLIAATKDPDRAGEIVKAQLGRVPHDKAMQDFAHTVNKIEATAKLPLFAISNMSQSAAPILRSSVKSFAKGVMDTFKGKDYAEESGALQSVLRSAFQEMGGESGISKIYGMSKSEKFNRAISANTGKYEVDSSFAKLKKDPTNKTARSRLADLLLEDVDEVLKQDALTDKQKKMAGFRMAEITQGITDPMDLPPVWSAHPLLKIPTMFKRFAFQQTKILRDAIKENPKRNIPIAAALYQVMGEAIGDTKAGISGAISGEGAEEKIKARGDIPERMLKNLADGFAFGILTDLISSTSPDNPPSSPYEWMVGPAISDTVKAASATHKSVVKGDPKPIVSEGIRKLPFGYAAEKRIMGKPDKPKRNKWVPSLQGLR